MPLALESYLNQAARWPASGRHILAQFDDESVVVYQAYRPAIGRYAAAHGAFGGEFSLGRMSWIKPNFLWMMYRSAWGTSEGQTVVLAVWLKRAAFAAILAEAVPSAFRADRYASEAEWREAVARSEVRVQWDPDHDPAGAPLTRRAIQLGLRGATLARYAHEWVHAIEDITPLVREQRPHALARDDARLMLPREDVYPVAGAAAAQLGIAAPGAGSARAPEQPDPPASVGMMPASSLDSFRGRDSA
jgi:hypothetical protein